MSNAPVLVLQPADHDCPTWCASEPHAESTGSHISAPVKLPAPKGMNPQVEVPLLSVQVSLGHDERARGEQPRLWLAATDGTAELDRSALGALIEDLEDFALRLRGLRHRYDNVIVGGAAEAIDHYPEPNHPIELVTPCPPWCEYREWEEHTPTALISEHFHAADTHVMRLDLQPVTRTKGVLEPEHLELGLAHMAHASLPQIDLTVGGPTLERFRCVSLTFPEAEELRSVLSEFLAQGREYVQPGHVASLEELTGYCGVRLIEHERDEKGFRGHAVGDTRQGGPVWVTVPEGMNRPRLEDLVSYLLADIHERQPEVTDLKGEQVRQAGEVPCVRPESVIRPAA
ncbi:DUF6907 domain-containing protein [Streptomyces cavernicola]|uniref:Uncharacterized protein n=1 Tax=Streptomyces cavernicola TaxID=3043613 RepID=A0ABT6S6A6_9ACTN|nr:hypothetical protein [Streptomyces sp. B-S-A6]MDI3402866.1 hypothetical protein [Streptomyces sp. B-S-A6]